MGCGDVTGETRAWVEEATYVGVMVGRRGISAEWDGEGRKGE